MTTNSYFSSSYNATTKDQILVENLIIEAIQAYGVDIPYIPRTNVNLDLLYGEDQSTSYDTAYTVEMYIKSIDGFGGDGNFIAKFGLEIRDEVILSVTRKRFAEEITANDATITHPREGDLLLLPTVVDDRNRLFEISYVEEEEVYYQEGNLYTYEIRCKVFEMGGETFDTGIAEIDDYSKYALTRTLQMGTSTGDYTVGEIVNNGTDTAEVVAWDNSNNELTLIKVTGDFIEGDVVGQSSAVTYPIASTKNIINDIDKEEFSDNDKITDEANGLVDFSETDPFGEL